MQLLYLASIVTLVSCTGYLKIRLKSDYPQDVSVHLKEESNENYAVVPLRLLEKVDQEFGRLRIDFEKSYTLRIDGGKVEKLGINSSTFEGEFKPLRGRISPKDLHLPMSGLQLLVECDEKWSGDKCDILCDKGKNDDKKCVVELVEQDLILSTDYTIDMENLPTIIQRLKGTMEVQNDLRKEETKQSDEEETVRIMLKKEQKIVEKTSKSVEWKGRSEDKKELFGGLADIFGSILPSLDTKKKMPFKFTMTARGNEEENDQEDEVVHPTRRLKQRKEDETKEKLNGLKTDLTKSLMGMFSSMGGTKPKKEEEPDFGDAGALRMGLPSMMDPMMSMMNPMSILSMLNRMPRHAVEGSGHVPDDFEMDQIIKN